MRKLAFPAVTISRPGEVRIYHEGMTLRDWFAGQALAGLLADPNVIDPDSAVARAAYEYADAMIEARGQE
jgi:hypothetical protein